MNLESAPQIPSLFYSPRTQWGERESQVGGIGDKYLYAKEKEPM